MKKIAVSLIAISLTLQLAAQTTQIKYLSGTDAKNTVAWDFYCTGGRQSGRWTKIQVTSHWEQQGFGA